MVDEEKVEEVVEEIQVETPPVGEPEVKPDDRPEKNWQAEIDRKIAKAVAEKDDVITRLESQINDVRDNQTAKELEAEKAAMESKFTDLGFDSEVLAIIRGEMDGRIKQARSEMERQFIGETTAMKKQINSSTKDRYLNEIKSGDTTGLVAKHFAAIEGVIDELDPEVWGSKQGMKNAVSMVLGDIMMKNPTVVKPKSASPTNDGPTPRPAKSVTSAKKSTIDKFRDMGADEETAAAAARASDELDEVFYNQE